MIGRRILALVGFLIAAQLVSGQPIITEFMASNKSTLRDENFDYSDWIEIYNPTAAAINLGGWHLTDRADRPEMWTFPNMTLGPKEYLLVFASGKDRRVVGKELHTNFSLSADGEYLGLIAPDGVTVGNHFSPSYPPQEEDISYGVSLPTKWVSLVGPGSHARIAVPKDGAFGTTWIDAEFDDSAWLSGSVGFGFDRKGVEINRRNYLPFIHTDIGDLMHNENASVYARVPFNIDNLADVISLELKIYYNDGFIAYINNDANRVDSANQSGYWWYSMASYDYSNSPVIPESIKIIPSNSSFLKQGKNVLSLHGTNVRRGNPDFLLSPELKLHLSEPEFSKNGYFATPTPRGRNSGNDGLILDEKVVFSRGSGTFSDDLSVGLSGAGDGQVIRYTLDGGIPTVESPLYTGMISRSSTTLLRAKVFDVSGASGRLTTAHYQKLSSALANRKSNLPMLILDAHGQGLNDTVRKPGYFQLFDRDANGVSSLSSEPTVATRQGIRWRGFTSLGQPKKPYSIEFWGEAAESVRLPVLGMPAESDWVLYAPFSMDRSFTRNSIMYELSRQMGRWAPNTRFIEVFFNPTGQELTEVHYVGVYLIVEQVKMNSRRLGYSVVERVHVPPTAAYDLLDQGSWTGGYLLKIDRADSDELSWLTKRGFPTRSSTPNSFCLARPKRADLGSNQGSYIRNYVQGFENGLAADRVSNFSTRNYQKYIDPSSWIDHLILCSFSKNPDALRLSAFLHKPANLPLYAGPLWDFDRSLDSSDPRDNDPESWYGPGDGTRYFEYDLWGMLCSDPDFAQAYYDRWAELRQTVFSDANLTLVINSMGNEIENSGNGIGSAAVRDAARWPQNAPRGGAFINETDHVRHWALARANWMDRRMFSESTLPVPPVISVVGDTVTLTAPDTVYYSIYNDPRAVDGVISGTTYSAPFQVTGKAVVTARSRNAGGLWSTPVTYTFNPTPVAAVFLPTGTAAWTQNANWTTDPNSYPNAAGALAEVGAPATGDRNVDLRAAVTIGSLTMPQVTASGRNRLRDQGTGNGLTFDGGSGNAKLNVGGTGTGYVEFEVAAGVALQSDLEVDVSNIVGNSEYGALRIRESWSGPGGFIKKGAGVASFTGEFKLYAGPTRIEEGVLRVTGPSAMANSPSIIVLDGGQLRLISSSSPGQPRVHTFGGDIFLGGHGRGESIPEASAQGKKGALRYDPGTTDNYATVTNPVEMMSDGGIYIDGPTNLLELTGGIRGTGALEKSGGGTLFLTGDNSAYTAPVRVVTGGIRLRGNVGSAITVDESTRLDAAGIVGSVSGSGSLLLPATILRTASLDGLKRAMVFKKTGTPSFANTMGSGNSLAITGSPGTPVSADYYVDLTAPVSTGTAVRGGYLLPRGAAWTPLLDAPTRVFVTDAAGNHNFDGGTWTLDATATVASVPVSQRLGEELLTGRMLEIRFDGTSITYEGWKNAFFPPEQASNSAISGPTATPFGDGIANLIRYALGVSGSENVFDKLPSVEKTESGVNFILPYDARLRGIRWRVQASEDLEDWTSAEELFDSNDDLVMPAENGRISIPEGTSSKRFYRLSVSEDFSR